MQFLFELAQTSAQLESFVLPGCHLDIQQILQMHDLCSIFLHLFGQSIAIDYQGI